MPFIMSQNFVRQAIANLAEDQKCIDMHEGSCNIKAMGQLTAGVRSMAKIYFIVHLLPLLLNYKKHKKNPTAALKKFILGFAKSMLFVAGSLFVIRRGICLYTNWIAFSNTSAIFTGFVASLPLLFESQGRRTEISLFCVSKSAEIAYMMFQRRYPQMRLPYGEGWLLALSAAVLSYFFVNEKQIFRPTYKSVLDHIFKNI